MSEWRSPNPRHRDQRYVDILCSSKSTCGWKRVLVGVWLFLFWNYSCGLYHVLSVFRPLQNHRLVRGQRDSAPQLRPRRLIGDRWRWRRADGGVLFTQFLGRGGGDGDMSLAILDARWSDGGEYGCRVGLPVRFNDHKINIELVIARVRPLKRYQIKLRFKTD